MCLLLRTTEKDAWFARLIPARNAQPQPNHEEIADKSKQRKILQNNWSKVLENVKVLRDFKKAGELFQDKGAQGDTATKQQEILDWILDWKEKQEN